MARVKGETRNRQLAKGINAIPKGVMYRMAGKFKAHKAAAPAPAAAKATIRSR